MLDSASGRASTIGHSRFHQHFMLLSSTTLPRLPNHLKLLQCFRSPIFWLRCFRLRVVLSTSMLCCYLFLHVLHVVSSTAASSDLISTTRFLILPMFRLSTISRLYFFVLFFRLRFDVASIWTTTVLPTISPSPSIAFKCSTNDSSITSSVLPTISPSIASAVQPTVPPTVYATIPPTSASSTNSSMLFCQSFL